MNPYQPPGPPPQAYAQPVSRTPFVLAGVGAFLASGYWALLTLLIGLAAASGNQVSIANMILPIVLIALYAFRGIQVMKGDPASARSLLWLHGIGGFFAVTQIASSAGAVFLVLQGLKVLIHIFGGIFAFLAHRQATTLPPI